MGTPADVENDAPGEKGGGLRCNQVLQGPGLGGADTAGAAEKTSYLDRCLDMWRDFTDLVYTVDGMMGEDVRVSKKWLA